MTDTPPLTVNVVADVDVSPLHPIVPATVQFLWDLREHHPFFTVYDHPQDFPDHFIARMWLSLPEVTAVRFVLRSATLDPLRETLEAFGLVHLDRFAADDPVILEVWR